MTTTVDVERVALEGTIGIGFGIEPESGDRVKFAGDWRPMAEIGEALAQGNPVTVELEPWAVLGRWSG